MDSKLLEAIAEKIARKAMKILQDEGVALGTPITDEGMDSIEDALMDAQLQMDLGPADIDEENALQLNEKAQTILLEMLNKPKA